MNKTGSALLLQRLVYDRIEFERKGFKNNNELTFKMQVQISQEEQDNYKVTLIIEGDKEEEYHFLISLSGYFAVDRGDMPDDKKAEELISRNAVAILMPYLRSEVTLLTAQPETDSVVLPPFNINKMMESKSK